MGKCFSLQKEESVFVNSKGSLIIQFEGSKFYCNQTQVSKQVQRSNSFYQQLDNLFPQGGFLDYLQSQPKTDQVKQQITKCNTQDDEQCIDCRTGVMQEIIPSKTVNLKGSKVKFHPFCKGQRLCCKIDKCGQNSIQCQWCLLGFGTVDEMNIKYQEYLKQQQKEQQQKQQQVKQQQKNEKQPKKYKF